MTTSTAESEPERSRAECSGRSILELDADGQLLELLGGDGAVERRHVTLRDAVARMRDRVREIAVGGDHEQPTAVGVEPADGTSPGTGSMRSITVRRWYGSLRVVTTPDRLVEDDRDSNCAGRDAVAVDAHPIDRRVDDGRRAYSTRR